MALTNCTISSITINPTAGAVLGSQTGTLTITPDTGYVVAASAFTNNTNLSATNADGTLTNTSKAIQSIGSATDTGTPSTSGNTVTFLITFSPSFVVPSSNLDLEVDIDGAATNEAETVSGTFDVFIEGAISAGTAVIVGNTGTTSFTTTQLGTINYSASGSEDSGTTIGEITLTPATNYEWVEDPTVDLSGIGNSSNYTVVETSGGTATTYRKLRFTYTYPSANASGEKIRINAKLAYKPTITSSIKAHTLNIDKDSIDSTGGSLSVNIYGTPGAVFSLLACRGQSDNTFGMDLNGIKSNTTDTFELLTNLTDIEMPNSGVFVAKTNVPVLSRVSTSQKIVFTLSSSTLDSSLVTHLGRAVFTVTQNSVVDYVIAIQEGGSGTGTDWTIPANTTVVDDGQPGKEIGQQRDFTFGESFSKSITLAGQGSRKAYVIKQPTSSNASTFFTNLQANGWDVKIDSVTLTGHGGTSLTMVVAGKVFEYGTSTTNSVVELDNFTVATAAGETPTNLGVTTQYTIKESGDGSATFNGQVALTFDSSDTTFYACNVPTDIYKIYAGTGAATKVTLVDGYYYKFKAGAHGSTNDEYIGKYSLAIGTLTNIVKLID